MRFPRNDEAALLVNRPSLDFSANNPLKPAASAPPNLGPRSGLTKRKAHASLIPARNSNHGNILSRRGRKFIQVRTLGKTSADVMLESRKGLDWKSWPAFNSMKQLAPNCLSPSFLCFDELRHRDTKFYDEVFSDLITGSPVHKKILAELRRCEINEIPLSSEKEDMSSKQLPDFTDESYSYSGCLSPSFFCIDELHMKDDFTFDEPFVRWNVHVGSLFSQLISSDLDIFPFKTKHSSGKCLAIEGQSSPLYLEVSSSTSSHSLPNFASEALDFVDNSSDIKFPRRTEDISKWSCSHHEIENVRLPAIEKPLPTDTFGSSETWCLFSSSRLTKDFERTSLWVSMLNSQDGNSKLTLTCNGSDKFHANFLSTHYRIAKNIEIHIVDSSNSTIDEEDCGSLFSSEITGSNDLSLYEGLSCSTMFLEHPFLATTEVSSLLGPDNNLQGLDDDGPLFWPFDQNDCRYDNLNWDYSCISPSCSNRDKSNTTCRIGRGKKVNSHHYNWNILQNHTKYGCDRSGNPYCEPSNGSLFQCESSKENVFDSSPEVLPYNLESDIEFMSIEELVGMEEFDGHEGIDKDLLVDQFSSEDLFGSDFFDKSDKRLVVRIGERFPNF